MKPQDKSLGCASWTREGEDWHSEMIVRMTGALSGCLSIVIDLQIRILVGLAVYVCAAVLCLVAQLCPILCDPRLPCPWDSPGKNTGVGCHAFLQGHFLLQQIFLTQGSNQSPLCHLHWASGFYHKIHLGRPVTAEPSKNPRTHTLNSTVTSP